MIYYLLLLRNALGQYDYDFNNHRSHPHSRRRRDIFSNYTNDIYPLAISLSGAQQGYMVQTCKMKHDDQETGCESDENCIAINGNYCDFDRKDHLCYCAKKCWLYGFGIIPTEDDIPENLQ